LFYGKLDQIIHRLDDFNNRLIDISKRVERIEAIVVS